MLALRFSSTSASATSEARRERDAQRTLGASSWSAGRYRARLARLVVDKQTAVCENGLAIELNRRSEEYPVNVNVGSGHSAEPDVTSESDMRRAHDFFVLEHVSGNPCCRIRPDPELGDQATVRPSGIEGLQEPASRILICCDSASAFDDDFESAIGACRNLRMSRRR
jgi:hypothetical protein